ncbi:hypothetical protein [Oceanobacillus sp. CAU 1775]
MKPVSYQRIGIDMFLVQISWSYWFLGITLAVHLFRLISPTEVDTFYSGGYISSNIFMLIIGILAISFLRYYVENGITRKNYFYGGLIGSVLLSVALPILIYILSQLERFIVSIFTNKVFNSSTLVDLDVDVEGNFLGEIILSVILTPFVSAEQNLILSLSLFSLNIFIFYIVGWLIGSAFQRLGVIAGIVIVFVGMAVIAVKDSMMRIALDMPLYENFMFLDFVPKVLAIPVIFIVMILVIAAIRLLTRSLALKI